MLTLAIVEDNTALREALSDVFEAEGHAVHGFDSAETFWATPGGAGADIVLLDLNLPGEDGIITARRLRAAHPGIGIIMLTARSEPEDRRTGYGSGADIYLAKPSSVPELTAAVEALARRLAVAPPDPETLTLDPGLLTLTGPAGVVPLSASECALLAGFAHAPGNRLETTCIARLAGGDGDMSKAAVEVRIVRLRKKVQAAGAPGQPFKAVRHWGYQLAVRIAVV